ncbi:MAG: Transglutaminase-like superfamily [Halomonas sp. HL-93]|nr:MAG: Transglutaminase-like superfamily [Halomonas sp. HL-93]
MWFSNGKIIRRFIALPWARKREILWLARKLIWIDRQLKLCGLVSARKALLELPDLPNNLFVDISPRQIARTLDQAARISIGKNETCLRRSLLLWWILTKRCAQPQLRVGVALRDGNLKAHAWVEIDGQPVNEKMNISNLYKPIELGAFPSQ